MSAQAATQICISLDPAESAETPIRRGPCEGAVPGSMLSWGRATEFRVFAELAASGQAWKLPSGERVYDPAHELIRKYLAREAGVADEAWEAAAPEDQRQSLAWCRFLELVEVSAANRAAAGMSLKEAYGRACENVGMSELGQVVALPTFYERRRKYLGANRARSSQLDNRGRRTGPRRTAFDRDAWAYFEGLWLSQKVRSVRSCYEQTAARATEQGWAWPSYDAVKRRVRKAFPPPIADRFRLAERQWRTKYEPKLVRDRRSVRGNFAWEIDHVRDDLNARDGAQKARAWTTLIVDVGSNLIVGWAKTTNPSSDSLAVAIQRAVTRYGSPSHIYMDNGLDMHDATIGGRRRKVADERWVRAVCHRIGSEVHFCRVRSPESKGGVEQMGNIIHNEFDKLWPSYCGGSPGKKPDQIDKWCREHLDELPTLEDLESAFNQFVETIADRPFLKTDDGWLSRRQCFERDRMPKKTLPVEELRVLLLKLVGPRKVKNKGVLWNGLWYSDDGGRMFEYQDKEVMLRVDVQDVSRVYVCDLSGKVKFIARQNLVKGSSDDIRRGRRQVAKAKRICKEARLQQTVALDDLPMAVLRAQAERYRKQTGVLNPPAEQRPALTVAPITTPDAQAICESSEEIRRAERRDALQPHPFAGPPALAGLSLDELQALALPDDDELAARDEAELDELCG